ncbi:MAG: hypothetical protein R6U35_06715 [Candidatus Humimicrobiaceae bacterium]
MDILLYIKYFFSLVSPVFVGYIPVYYLLLRRKILDLEYKNLSGKFFITFISFYIGSFIICILMMVLSMFGFNLEFDYVLVFVLVCISISAYLYFSKKFRYREKIRLKKMIKGTVTIEDNLKIKKGKVINGSKPKKISFRLDRGKLGDVLFALVAVLIFANFLAVLFFTFLFPVRFWDAVACWSLKGKAFFIDSDIFTFFTQHDYWFSHPSYPLYLSLLQTWIYTWLGKVDENLVKVIFPLFYLSLVFICYHFFRKKINRILSVILVFVLSSIPIIVDHGYIEYSNLLFSVILLLAVYFLYLWRARRKIGSYVILSGVFFALLSFIRGEGILFLALFFALGIIFLFMDLFRLKHYKATIINFFASVILTFLLIIPWYLLKFGLGIPALPIEWSSFIAGGGDIVGSFNSFRAASALVKEFIFSAYDSPRAFLGSFYGPAWIILFILFFVNIKRLFSRNNWIPFIFILFGMLTVFVSIGFVSDFEGSIDRYLLHFFPLTYLWILSNLPNSKKLE